MDFQSKVGLVAATACASTFVVALLSKRGTPRKSKKSKIEARAPNQADEARGPEKSAGEESNEEKIVEPVALAAAPLALPAPQVPAGMIPLRELEALLVKAVETQRSEQVSEGLASIRNAMSHSMSQSPDMLTRLGVMTSSKVIEINKMLLEEMEESLKWKLGYICSLFHRWRAEVTICIAGRNSQKKLKLRQEELDNYLRLEKARFDHEGSLVTERAARNEARWRKATDMMLAQWALSGTEGLLGSAVRGWCAVTQNQRELRAQDKCLERVSNCGHGVVLKWIEGSTIGNLHSCFVHWKLQAEATQKERKTQTRIECILADEKGRRDALMTEHRSEEQRQKDRQHAVVGYTLARWQRGDDAALASKLYQAWYTWCRESRRLSTSRQNVHCALLRCFEGDERGILHVCVMNWKFWAKHQWQIREGDARISDERKRWENYMEDTSKEHAESLAQIKDESTLRCARAHRATEVMLRQWFKGDSAGLLSAVFVEWHQVVVLAADVQRRMQSVRLSVLRFCEGDRAAVIQCCFLNWKQYASVQRVYRLEVSEHEETITKLRERTKSLLGKEQQRILKYAKFMCGGADEVQMLMVLSQWHQSTSAEERRRAAVEGEELRRVSMLAHTKHREFAVASIRALGKKDSSLLQLDCFLAWSQDSQVARLDQLRKLKSNTAMGQYSEYTLSQFTKQDDTSLVALIFWKLHRFCIRARHEQEQEKAQRRYEDVEADLNDMANERADLQAELQRAYANIDQLSENLQQELKTKEGLAQELSDLLKQRRLPTTSPRSHNPSTSFDQQRSPRVIGENRATPRIYDAKAPGHPADVKLNLKFSQQSPRS